MISRGQKNYSRKPDSLEKSSNYLVIIPAYNEEETIEEIILKAKTYADVCVINDNSQDATPEILAHINGIHVIHHEENTHLPGGILDGMKYAFEKGYEYAITMDAGLSHDPDEISLFMNHDHSDLVIGVRTQKVNTPLLRRLLSKGGNLVYNFSLDFPKSLLKTKYYKDITSGFRRYSNRAMKLLLSREIRSQSFDILFETSMYIYKNKLSISEVPITYNFSTSSLNKRVVRDCVRMCIHSLLKPRK